MYPLKGLYYAPPKNIVSTAGEFWEVLPSLPHPEGWDGQTLQAEEDNVRHLGDFTTDCDWEYGLQDK